MPKKASDASSLGPSVSVVAPAVRQSLLRQSLAVQQAALKEAQRAREDTAKFMGNLAKQLQESHNSTVAFQATLGNAMAALAAKF